MQAIKITDHVYWVGAIDWALKEFHGYTTHRGSTYNAFLILADKITLIDTVKAPFKQEMYERIRSVIGDETKVDILVSNHAEMDHSGALPEVIRDLKPEKIYASPMGIKALDAHFGIGSLLTAVKTGESISLGNMTLSAVETRMLHWPDSMFTYLAEEKVLFSQDGFGMHFATDKIFAVDNDWHVMLEEMKRYYANILLPYSPQVLNLLKVFPTLNLDVQTICPDHGPVWNGELLLKPLELYKAFAEQQYVPRAIVLYDTMWHSTEKMALHIADGIRQAGADVRVFALDAATRSDVAAELLDASALVAGSPTINNDMYPRTADVLTYLRGLRPKNMLGAAFGSYGWSGESVAKINAYLTDMKAELVSDGLKIQYVPKDADLEKCEDFGREIGARLLEKCHLTQPGKL